MRDGKAMVTGTRRRPLSVRLSGMASMSAGLHFLTSNLWQVAKGEPAPQRHDLDVVADTEQLVHFGREVDQQARVLAGYDALGARCQAAGDARPVANAGQIVHGEISRAVRIVDGDARFHMVAGPAKGRVADARVVDHAGHSRQHDRAAAGVGDVTRVAQGRLSDPTADGDLHELRSIGRGGWHLRDLLNVPRILLTGLAGMPILPPVASRQSIVDSQPAPGV